MKRGEAKLLARKEKFFTQMEDTEYTLDLFNYEGIDIPSIVICKEHGNFLLSPNHLLRGHGCPSCGRLKAAQNNIGNKAKQFFIKLGDELDLSKFTYSRNDHKSIVVCGSHGEYLASPNSLLSGSRCPECAIAITGWSANYNNLDQHILYYVFIPSINMWKIGVTRCGIKERFRKYKLDIEPLLIVPYNTGIAAYQMERLVLNTYISFRYKTQMLKDKEVPNILPDGNYELFTSNILEEVIFCIENN